MTNPTPGHGISTPYGRRGPYWSCSEDSSGNGIHTGNDHAAPDGATVVAARPGQIVHSNHGSAFGNHQVDVLPGDGTRDFYAHMRSRVPNGTRVKAGDKIGEVGSEGNVTGPHLHFERHATEFGGWSCSVVRDPTPSENHAAHSGQDDDMPDYAHAKHTHRVALKADQWLPIDWGNPVSGDKWFDDDGGPGIAIGGNRYTATLAVDVSRPDGGTLQTSWVEMEDAEAVETSMVASHGDVSNALDTRSGAVKKGRKLRARVRVTNHNATLEGADVALLFWDAD